MSVNLIWEHFPQLDPTQRARFEALKGLYAHWNAQINVISRKDMEQFYLHHVLHSLALAQLPGAPLQGPHPNGTPLRVLDVGTGGGFPGIPLAIAYPQTHFTLCDSIGKKIKVVEAVAHELGLTNVHPVVQRAEQLPPPAYDFIISRAVTRLSTFIPWVWKKLAPGGSILYLKGGDVTEEINEAARVNRIPKEQFSVTSIAPLFPKASDPFLSTKKICEIKQSLYLCAPKILN